LFSSEKGKANLLDEGSGALKKRALNRGKGFPSKGLKKKGAFKKENHYP